MYLDFYRLKSPPFQSTPDPTFLFVSASHQAALDALTAGITTRQGFVIITGAPGVGKTTLVRAYLARVTPPQLTAVVLWQARLSFRELLTLLVRRFAEPVATDDTEALLAQLRQILWHEAEQGRHVALLIDEAQDLPLETLTQLPLLADLPPARESPLQIVLVGRPALLQRLRRRALRHVAQHISLRATLRPLTEAESLMYIRQRVAKVALPGGPLFTQDALQAMVRHTRGVPRDLNLLCTNVLQAGYWEQQQPITADLVQQVLATTPGSTPLPLRRLGLAAAAGLVLVAGLVFVAGLLRVTPFSAGSQATRRSAVTQAPPKSEAPKPTNPLLPVAPPLQQPEPAPQTRAESTPGDAVGHDPSEGDDRLGPRESLERQPLETLPAPPTPSPPAPPRGRAIKSCDELKAEIQAKLDAKRVMGYVLTIVAKGDVQGHKIVGSCEGNTKKIILDRSRNTP
jgi:general secretion pathway protein A